MIALLNIVLLLPPMLPAQAEGVQPAPAASTSQATLERALATFDAATAAKARDAAEARRLYQSSLDQFESLDRAGIRNGRLHFNIANTHMALNQLGEAIAHYRIAQRLLPGDGAIEHNLRTARKLVQVSFDRPATSAIVETVFFWHFSTSPAARLRTAMIAYAIFWLLMLVLIRRWRRAPVLGWTAALAGLVAASAGGSVTYQRLADQQNPDGVITASETVLRKGNGDYYDPLLVKPLPEGVEFHVHMQRKDVQGDLWYQVQLPDQREGWLRADHVVLLDPV